MTGIETADDLHGWSALSEQPAVAASLRGAVEREEVSHAWLFVGPSGVGQVEAARALTCAINDDALLDADARERAMGRIRRGRHACVEDVEPTGPQYLVADVEEWARLVQSAPSEGARRVVRITAAERMSETAQNGFLKALEEPPASSLWIVECADEDALLETIRSRCRRVEFRPWSVAALQALAMERGRTEVEALAMARTAQGSRDALLDLLRRVRLPEDAQARTRTIGSEIDQLSVAPEGETPSEAKRRKAAQKRLEKEEGRLAKRSALDPRVGLNVIGQLIDHGPGAVTTATQMVMALATAASDEIRDEADAVMAATAAEYKELGIEWRASDRKTLERRFSRRVRDAKRGVFEATVDDLGIWLRDLLAVQAGGGQDAVVNVDRLDRLRKDAAVLTPTEITPLFARLPELRDAFERNAVPELQFEHLFMDCFGAIARSRAAAA